VSDLAAFDPHAERLQYVSDHFQAMPFSSLEEAISAVQPEIVLVCSPPCEHVRQAIVAIEAGADVFIEKPVSDSIERLDQLASEVRTRQAVVQVGYNLRFHPPIQKLKELVEQNAVGKIRWGQIHAGSYLPEWRPWQDYRRNYTSQRERGGGIILDGSHELDYVLWLFGVPVELICMGGKVSQLEINVEDCATMLLRFPNGAQLDVHVDFVQRSYTRGCTLAGEQGRLVWDFKANSVRIEPAQGEAQIIPFDCDTNYMYLREMEHFLDCVEQRSTPHCTLEDAIRTLRIALAARSASEERQWVRLDR